ncbi:MAG: right-handed parallel beta-helix repeat-containing protein [Akkermansiaceae bacterium]
MILSYPSAPSIAALAAVLLVAASAHAADIYVSPDGDDAWSGALPDPDDAKTDGPVATLGRARDLVRKRVREAQAEGAIHVFLRGGNYWLEKPVAMGREDSGTAKNPVIWSGFPRETARISGGRPVGPFKPVADPEILRRLPAEARPHVLQANLHDAGISDFGEVAQDRKRAELFFRGAPMTLARWPDADFAKIKDLPYTEEFTSHGIKGDRRGKFFYEGDRPQRWLEESDGWLSGYWFWDWADERQKILKIDPASGTLELQPPHHGYGFRKGQRYYAFNLLAELDSPGEWYLDRGTGTIYFWPPGPVDNNVTFSVLPELFSLRDVSHLTIRGLLMENTRGTAVTVSGGEHVLITGCRIRNTGGYGVAVSGVRSGVRACEIYQTGEGGISLSGGDRKTLSPGGLFAENNHIHGYARLVRTYRPAVAVGGVGNRISQNHIHDAPHNAIQLSGNDHVIEFNDIHHVCKETGDVGAFYMGRDWTMRGNLIRHNFFHEISGPGLHGAMAVYLDDAASGTTVSGNIFYKASRAVFIGGGRDNTVENNVFVECEPSVHLDARGLGWMHNHVAPDGVMTQRLKELPYQSSPWSDRYPELAKILEENPAAPRGNKVLRNISFGGRWKHVESKAEPGIVFADNLVDTDPHFVDAPNGNFALRGDSPAWALGFKPIPAGKIGVVEDDARRWIPPAE